MTENDLRDKNSAVYEAQEQLKILYKDGWKIPLVTPDGQYSSNTKRAVYDFQKNTGIKADGILNYATWTALFRIAAEIKARRTVTS